jgi:GDPmannose 4,6-dehydratase
VQQTQPDEIYNLAAQSHVAVSFETPEYTANADALGTLRILEAIRLLGLGNKTRFYQASTSEMYGKVQETPQRETTPFYPRSPYGVAKLYAYWITVNYREAYGLYACNGILFNHESPIRGETFVTRKITRGLARIREGLRRLSVPGQPRFVARLGPRARLRACPMADAAAGCAEDYVIATGEQHSVREFIERSAGHMDMRIEWRGSGIDEQGVDAKSGRTVVKIDPRYFRPTEVDTLLGDASKARAGSGWKAEIPFDQLVQEMVESDLEIAGAMRWWRARASRPTATGNETLRQVSGSDIAAQKKARIAPGLFIRECGAYQRPPPPPPELPR